MGKKWKKLWLARKVKKAAQEVADIVEETTKTVKKEKKRPFWKKKKDS